jgi:hypothetical protein
MSQGDTGYLLVGILDDENKDNILVFSDKSH